VGSGIGGEVRSLAVGNSALYAGGTFTNAGSVSANNIVKWDGATYSALYTGTNNAVYCVTVWNNKVYAGGYFTSAGGVSGTTKIAKYG
jgi:hypothetical protein